MSELMSEYLHPWFRQVPAQPGGWHLQISAERDEYAQLSSPVSADAPRHACFRFDQFMFFLPGWDDGDRKILADTARSCFLAVAPDEVRLIADPAAFRWRITAVWAALEIAATIQRRSHVDVHGACLENSDRAVLIVGPKKAGKTTLLLHCLRSRLCRWIANDRVLVDREAATVTGMPAAVRVRSSVVDEFPELLRGMPPISRPYLYTLDELASMAGDPLEDPAGFVALSPAQFSRQTETDPLSTAPLGAMVFPSIVAGFDGWSLQRLGIADVCTALRANLYGRTLGPRQATVFENIEGGVESPPDSVLQALAESVPGYRLFLGPNAYEQSGFAARFLDSLMRS